MNLRRVFVILALFASTGAASGYALLGLRWETSPVFMHLNLGASNGTLIDGSASWDAVATEALTTWNVYLQDLQFFAVKDSLRPGNHDGVNNVFFSPTIYGDNFGDAVAVTTEWRDPRKPAVRAEADVIFNSALAWNSYCGPLRKSAGGQTIYDLRRVALHEFGHAVGLDHPDGAGQDADAIMNGRVSAVDSLLHDDIRGGQTLYGARPGTYVGPMVKFTATLRRNFSTKDHRRRFAGTTDAKPNEGVLLGVSRQKGSLRLYRVKGTDPWQRIVPLKLGRNVISLYALGADGSTRKFSQVVVTRLRAD